MAAPRRSTHRSPARFLGRVLEGAKPAPFPRFVVPCPPTSRKAPPAGEDWLHEIKHDGYRLQALVREGSVSLYTSRGNDWAARMPTIAASVRALPVNNAILEGKLVAVDARGRAVFYELPSELKARVRAKFVYYAFDLLYRWLRPARRKTNRPQARAAGIARQHRRRSAREIRRALGGRRRRDLGTRVQAWAGGHCIEASRRAVPIWPARRMGENEVRGVERGEQKSP